MKISKLYIALIVILVTCSNCVFSQTSLVSFRKQIDSILIRIIGKADFDKHITFNEWRSKCDLWNGKKYLGSSDFRKDSVKFIPNQYSLWYDLDLVEGNYLDDRVYVDVFVRDTQTQILISRLPKCFGDSSICGKYLTADEAKGVAENQLLAKGLTDWETQFAWEKTGIDYLRNDSIKIVLDKGYYYWSISNVLSIRTPEPCLNGEGESLQINAITGAYIKKDNIDYGCSY